jgi:hypothetical protein
MHVENTCVFRASWAIPRLFSLVFNNLGKNAPQWVAFWLEIFLFKIDIACGKKLKRHVATSLNLINGDCSCLEIRFFSPAKLYAPENMWILHFDYSYAFSTPSFLTLWSDSIRFQFQMRRHWKSYLLQPTKIYDSKISFFRWNQIEKICLRISFALSICGLL